MLIRGESAPFSSRENVHLKCKFYMSSVSPCESRLGGLESDSQAYESEGWLRPSCERERRTDVGGQTVELFGGRAFCGG